jgi:amidohydrolase
MNEPDELKTLIAEEMASLIELRHDLHRHPEIRFAEKRTSGVVRRELESAGVTHRSGLAKGTGVLATIPGGKDGDRATGLRADMDALPIPEQSSFEYASASPGFMHACGHDGHTTILVGAARVLSKLAQRRRLPRPVTFLFQPAEEGGAGANEMIKDGCLDGSVLGPPVGEMFGLHGWPDLPLGCVVTKPGPVAAACDGFTVRITGKGCHAAFPHLGNDPIVAAAALIVALQSVVSRNVNPQSQAVLSVTRVSGGTAGNIIPGEVELEGTIRTLTTPDGELLRARLTECVHGISAAHRCTARIEWETPAYPPLHNDAKQVEVLENVAAAALGAENVRRMDAPVMGGEDFAYYTSHVPSCFFMIGLRPHDGRTVSGLHTPTFDFTDEAIATGVELFCRLALRE